MFGLAACAKTLADNGCEVEILTVRRPADGELVTLPPNVRITAFDDSGRGSFRRCPALGRALLQAGGDLIHSHGLWTDVHRLAAVLARQRGLPHLLAPCGMLAPGALRHHWWKKVPVRLWFQDRRCAMLNVSRPSPGTNTSTFASMACVIPWQLSRIRYLCRVWLQECPERIAAAFFKYRTRERSCYFLAVCTR